jgi:carboxyl-terminal processing protease
VQALVELPGGGGLKLTIAQYFTPSGRSIQATGIVPDVRIEAADVTLPDPPKGEADPMAAPVREADLSRHLENPTGAKAPAPPAPPSPDPTLARAVELLRAARILGGER